MWTIRVVHYRLARRGDAEGEPTLGAFMDDADKSGQLANLVLAPIAFVLWRYVFPLFDATVGQHPWIAASAENPHVRMVWRVLRVTGRHSVSEVVNEIASALERGDPRPAPNGAAWVGLDRGNVVLQERGLD